MYFKVSTFTNCRFSKKFFYKLCILENIIHIAVTRFMFYLHVIFCKIYSFTNHKCRSSIISSVHYKCFSFSKHIVLIITINQVALASKGWYDFPLGLISSNKIACGAVTYTIPIPLFLALLLSLTSGVLFISLIMVILFFHFILISKSLFLQSYTLNCIYHSYGQDLCLFLTQSLSLFPVVCPQ